MGGRNPWIQMSCSLQKLPRPLGSALGMLCKLSDEMREVITPDVVGRADEKAILRYPAG